MPWAARNAADTKLLRDGIHRGGRPFDIQMHLAADQLVRRDAPEHHVRIGHGRTSAFAVTGRSGIGARALGADAQQSALVHARDGAAARARPCEYRAWARAREARRWTLPAFRGAGHRRG